jgi:serralysin
MAAPSSADISSALLYANYWWGGSTVTYSVAATGSTWSGYGAGEEPSNAGYTVFNPVQAARFALAAEAWDAVIGISLVQTDDVSQQGQIRIAFTDADAFEGDVWGYASSPPTRGGTAGAQNGDIWIDNEKAGSGFADTTYDYMATLHELGHALGLKHPFEDGGTLPSGYDNHRYSVMSYTPYTDYVMRTVESTGTGIKTVVAGVYATTPMVFDILALQNRYGADPETGAGATTYSWSQAAPMMQAIYDAGGVDTFDLSAHTRGSIVDLTPGAYSSIAYFSGEAQAAYWAGIYPWAASWLSQQFNQASTYTWSNNLGIAYGTIIENVTGGSGADTFSGNDVANSLLGNAGDDSLGGLAGDDYLRGGDGNDAVQGGLGFDDINGNAGADTASGGQGNDWVVGGRDNDRLTGDDGDDIVYGNLGDDVCDGGIGADTVRGGQGDDSLVGGAGNDWLAGDRGADTISGGSGADIFHTFAGAGLDRVVDFSLAGGDRVLLMAGQSYTLSQSGSDTIVDLGAGDQLVLAGVSMSSLSGANWWA